MDKEEISVVIVFVSAFVLSAAFFLFTGSKFNKKHPALHVFAGKVFAFFCVFFFCIIIVALCLHHGWLVCFAVIGAGSLLYCISQIIMRKLDPDEDSFLGCVSYYLFLVSFLPAAPFLYLDNTTGNILYSKRMRDMKKLRVIAESWKMPQDHEIKIYSLECDRFVDEYGEFDLYEWKRYEYDKLGL